MNKETRQNSAPLTSSLVSIIKEKIGHGILYSNVNDSDKELHYNKKIIKSLSSDMLVFEDGSSLLWDYATNLRDLVGILIWVEEWLKAEKQKWISIRWSTYDFEELAEQKENEEHHEAGMIYDRSKFAEVLRLMEKNHDCNFGITWHDIDHYLDEHCRFQ